MSLTREVLETVASFVPPLPESPIIDLRMSDMNGGPTLANRASTGTIPANLIAQTGPVDVQLTADAFGTRDFLNRTLPAGTYTFALLAKANGAAQSIKFGHLQSGLVTEPVGLSGSTLSVTFTLASPAVARLLIQRDGDPVDIVCDEIQLYEGSSVPAFAEEYDGYLTTDCRVDDLPADGDALDAGSSLRAFIPLANYPATTTFTEGTMFVMFRTDDTSGTPKAIVSTEGSGSGWHVSVVSGRVTCSPVENWSNPGDERFVAGTGWHCAASRFSATDATAFLDGMRMNHKEAAIPAQSAEVLGALSWPPSHVLGTYPFIGQVSAIVVYDRALTDWEVTRATRNIVAQHNTYENAPAVPLKVAIAMGDSITTGANVTGGSYFHRHFAGGKPGWIGVNLATSGQGIRYDRWEDCERMVIAAREQGHRAVVSIFHGANDQLTADDFDEYQRRWKQMRTMGAGTIVFTVPPRDIPGWETKRLAFNDDIREAYVNGQFDVLVDVGAHAIMGNPANPAALNYYRDHTHPDGDGHDLIAPMYADALEVFG